MYFSHCHSILLNIIPRPIRFISVGQEAMEGSEVYFEFCKIKYDTNPNAESARFANRDQSWDDNKI